MVLKKIILSVISIILIGACTTSSTESLKPLPSGAPGDLVVVMNESHWDAAPGDTLLNIVAGPYEALPKPEPMFNVIHVTHKGFGKTIKQQRNIIVTKIGKDQPDAKILIKKDLWAKTQLLISILAPTREEFVSLVIENRGKIIALLNDTERQRLMNVNKGNRDNKIEAALQKKFHINLQIPKGYKIDVYTSDFMWLSHEYRDVIQGIFVYTYDYSDPNNFKRDFLIEKRNNLLKRNVPGEIEGSFMITEPLFPPIMSEFNLNEEYTVELQGLWRMEGGYAMGGPFISLVQLDEVRNNIITVEGFVFAPAHKKRELIRQMESIIFSLEILDQKVN